jgi:hypothetical protein
MTDMHTVRASGPADLLALVPGLLGFHPEDSVVVITLGDATHRFHARVDLPSDPVGVEDLADYLTRVAHRNGVRSLAVIVYTDDASLADALVDELAGRLLAVHVELVCAVRADGERWWCVDGHAAGGPGTPYDVSAHPLMAQAVVDGTVVLGSRRELADSLVGTDPTETEEIERLAEEVTLRMVQAAGSPLGAEAARHHLVVEGRWVRHRVRRHLEDHHRLDAADVARLLVLVHVSLEVRDVAWAEMTHRNAAQHVALWRDVVRRAPVQLRAAPAALLGFAAWLSGNGALAWCAVDCAQESQPDYGLASLLTEALAGAVPPSAWKPLPAGALTLFEDQ